METTSNHPERLLEPSQGGCGHLARAHLSSVGNYLHSCSCIFMWESYLCGSDGSLSGHFNLYAVCTPPTIIVVRIEPNLTQQLDTIRRPGPKPLSCWIKVRSDNARTHHASVRPSVRSVRPHRLIGSSYARSATDELETMRPYTTHKPGMRD